MYSDLQIFRSRPAESASCASVNQAAPAFRMPYSQTLIAKFHSFGLQAVGAPVNIRRESDVILRLTPRAQHEPGPSGETQALKERSSRGARAFRKA